MSTLAEDVSKILDYHVEPGKYEIAFNRLDVTGKFDRKMVNRILLLILDRIEKLEEKNHGSYDGAVKEDPTL